jgi:regulator of protease activity HflC (stomatin/prohibitin superfamily)
VAEGNGGEESGAAAPKPQPRQSRAPIGGMVSDPRERDVKTGPSFTAFLRDRVSTGIGGGLTFVGIRRPRNPDGTLGPRSWKRLFVSIATVFAIAFVWTSIHIVQPGTVAVPVTLGHAGDPIGPGFHITLPFTTTYSMPVRVQNYTMSFIRGEGASGNADDSVAVLGSDGGAANVNATVLYRVDPKKATFVYKTIGTKYASTIVRPTARFCIRNQFTLYPLIAAATVDFKKIQSDAAKCFRDAVEPQGLIVQDFQLREVALSAQLQSAVNSKVASQQNAEQQKFELATALQAADITRIQALATADSQQILACGGHAETLQKDGQQVQTVVPNALTACSQAQLTQPYLQFTYIQALKALVASPNASTIILPFDQNLTPLINVGGNSSTNSAGTATVTTTPPPSKP